MPGFGTLTSLDSRAAQQTTVQAFGINDAYAAVQAQLDAHNANVQDMLALLCDDTTDNLRVYGPNADMGMMQELDSGGSPYAQKVAMGYNIGFPLDFFGRALQWDRGWSLITSMQELEDQVTAIMVADRLNVQRAIKGALYNPVNNSTYKDMNVKGITLPLKALFNNDGTTPPSGPNGESFATSHTHYLWSTTFSEAAAKTQIDTVREHRTGGSIRYLINVADANTVKGFTDFTPVLPAYLNPGANITTAQGVLDVENPDNRMIGYFNGAEVWVKPYIIANYPIAIRVGLARAQPLVYRRRMLGAGFGDLTLQYENDLFPLHAKGWGREFGVSVWNRDTAAVSEMNDSDSAYTAPTV